MLISAAAWPTDAATLDALRRGLAACPDVAFAHLADVRVQDLQSTPEPALLVWLAPAALGSIRPALNLVSDEVAKVLPRGRFLDVVILNSAPELLDRLEAVGRLVVDNDPDERQRARMSSQDLAGYQPLPPRRRWWWPF